MHILEIKILAICYVLVYIVLLLFFNKAVFLITINDTSDIIMHADSGCVSMRMIKVESCVYIQLLFTTKEKVKAY